MADQSQIASITVQGFRAYLQPKTFEFGKKPCLAIFAPNGSGKSSLIDALEFMLSDDGTLERLGQRAANNRAGPTALAHNLADEAKITPSVKLSVKTSGDTVDGVRTALGNSWPMPSVAANLSTRLAVSPIIRGHGLRAFVEAQTPEQRYADVAGWLQLAPLVDVQKNIRALRTQIKTAAEDQYALTRINAQLAKETSQQVMAWEPAAVLAFLNNELLAPLDAELQFAELATTDPGYVELAARAKAEESQLGLAGLRQILAAASALWAQETDPDTGNVTVSGAIVAFLNAIETVEAAEAEEAEEKEKAANATFQSVWQAAAPLFAEGKPHPDTCPVCDTPILKTSAGSAEAIRDHVAGHLAGLADYAEAKRALDQAEAASTRSHNQLMTALPTLIGLLGDDEADLKNQLLSFQLAVKEWPENDVPDTSIVLLGIAELKDQLTAAIEEIEERQGEHTYGKAKIVADRLLALQDEREAEIRYKDELEKLSDALTAQATSISAAIRTKMQSLLDVLRVPMNEIYREIQGSDAVPIKLELPTGEGATSNRLFLLIDFAENRPDVQPGGYLSDSQIHSVALALRMAAIKQFNPTAPIMALDDIVTSYDADHRRAISGLIAKMFGDMQIIVTTHDERFFNYLKDQLDPASWQYQRIIGLDPSYGPRFADHKVTDEMIDAMWAQGKSAANEMRQAEEEWLLKTCREFGVSVRIRPLEKAYSYERSELAMALAAYLHDAKLEPAAVPGVTNRFLTSLQKGEIENFGSHFQDGPYGDGSIGDEKARWAEFAAFRGQFDCKKCGRTKFQRPITLKRPVCAHDKCEAQFEFAAAPATAA